MKRILPHHLLLATAVLLVITATFFSSANSVIDIQMHDTYFIIAHQQLGYILGAFCLMLWVVYLLANRLLFSKLLQWIHLVLTIVPCCLLGLALILDVSNSSTVNPTNTNGNIAWNNMEQYADAFAAFIFLLLLAQVLLLIHLLLGLIRKFIRR
ncbi:hypothetical protein [Phnomibacter ginsenosidimutans]|uniref:Uncharacterized protein n=1 Tax=Phnomibacter ginsenosidimutans TaxID=2676868 RepID=A0A6I6GC94_9BACT|nr:hypothetical protein [Phnomibacter ginsenosidimutans]QGW27850.1 hypothetical protein GLV81_06850 [Phnomibacter ginsenosidimutans]